MNVTVNLIFGWMDVVALVTVVVSCSMLPNVKSNVVYSVTVLSNGQSEPL